MGKRIALIFSIALFTSACSESGEDASSNTPQGVADAARSVDPPAAPAPDGGGETTGSEDETRPDGPAETIPLVASDVSFLIPLRAVNGFGAETTGGHGPLLPRPYFDRLEALTRIDDADTIYQNLDVVGVRLDPCFVESHNTVDCESQIRIVLQPVIGSADEYAARDATIHAFYRVPRDELNALAQALAQLRIDEGGDTVIGQHPMAASAADLLLPALGSNRLSRITFVSVHASDEAWSFGGFDVVNGTLRHHELVGVDDHEQHLTSLGGTETLDASILPEPVIETQAARFMELYVRDEMSLDETESAHAGLHRLLDPSVHDTGTVDCASCHMATASAYFVDGQLGLTIPDVYANTQNQRMFGYFGTEQSISPRVNAETEVVLGAFERLR